tara:strand:- start:645 stop:893 length:249 start_codon:yes stop_codon:yes gene_type:complete
MPTKATESLCFEPGKLVRSRTTIYSSTPIEQLVGTYNHIAGGTVGVIISGPRPETGYGHQYQVQFLNNVVWWVDPNEIEPYF